MIEDKRNMNRERRQAGRGNTSNVVRILKYAAASLAFISFLTGANGLMAVVAAPWQAYLVSFGIQSIVLVLGLYYFDVRDLLKNKAVLALRIFIIVLYIFSVLFSSFFAYVFLAEHAYKAVRETDYNIAIDSFLIRETRQLRSINDAIGDVLLREIQSYAPHFAALTIEFQDGAQTDLEDIINNPNLQVYDIDSIPESDIFRAQAIFDVIGEDLGGLSERLRIAERFLEASAESYLLFYGEYYRLFNELQNVNSLDQLENIIEATQLLLDNLEGELYRLEDFDPNIGFHNPRAFNSRDTVITRWNNLRQALQTLQGVSGQIEVTESIDNINLDLQGQSGNKTVH